MKITHNNKEYTLDVEKAVKDGYLKEEYPKPQVGEYYQNFVTESIFLVMQIYEMGYTLVNVKNGETFYVQENLDNSIFCGLRKHMNKIDNPFV